MFLIGFAATAAQFLATHKHHDVLAYCAFAAYAVSLLAGVQTFRVAEHKDPEPRPMIVTHVRSHKSQVLIELAASRASMFEENKRRHDEKVRYWTITRRRAGHRYVPSADGTCHRAPGPSRPAPGTRRR
ncbi:hypothetical protein AB0N31_35950, partial [Streptomyces sp. NPDC051051]